MAQFDLKKATIRFCDGRLATLTTTASNGVNAQVTLTDKSTHRGTREPVSIALVDPGGNSQALAVTVTGVNISVSLATDGSGVITTTASQLKAAIEADADANALVTVTLPGTGAGVVSAQSATDLATGARTLTVKISEGTINFTEKKNRKYTRSRGQLSTVMDGDEEPVEVKIDAIWEFLTASSGGSPTPRDVLYNTGEAAAWVTTDPDPCQPYCVDIEIYYDPGCSGIEKEYVMLELFRYEQIDYAGNNGVLSISGKCNVTQASLYRAA